MDPRRRPERAGRPVRAEVSDHAAAIAEARIELAVRRVAATTKPSAPAAVVVLAALAVARRDDTPVGLESKRMRPGGRTSSGRVRVPRPAPAERRVSAPAVCSGRVRRRNRPHRQRRSCRRVESHLRRRRRSSPPRSALCRLSEARVEAAVRQVPGEAETPPPEVQPSCWQDEVPATSDPPSGSIAERERLVEAGLRRQALRRGVTRALARCGRPHWRRAR